jgi:hypothetical protein
MLKARGGKVRVGVARGQKPRAFAQGPPNTGEMTVKFIDVVGSRVGERPLRDRPDAFVGIQLPSMGRESFEPEARERATEVAHRIARVDVAVVPDGDHLSAEMPE